MQTKTDAAHGATVMRAAEKKEDDSLKMHLVTGYIVNGPMLTGFGLDAMEPLALLDSKPAGLQVTSAEWGGVCGGVFGALCGRQQGAPACIWNQRTADAFDQGYEGPRPARGWRLRRPTKDQSDDGGGVAVGICAETGRQGS